MTECKSCLHSCGYADGAYLGLYCEKHRKDCETVSECDSYVYEPGTDAEERDRG